MSNTTTGYMVGGMGIDVTSPEEGLQERLAAYAGRISPGVNIGNGMAARIAAYAGALRKEAGNANV